MIDYQYVSYRLKEEVLFSDSKVNEIAVWHSEYSDPVCSKSNRPTVITIKQNDNVLFEGTLAELTARLQQVKELEENISLLEDNQVRVPA